MEREGYQPATRSRGTRRALTGVAAGAVLALGAVVGSLLLNHGTATTTGGTLASGSQSGGDIVLAETGSPSSSTPVQSTPQAAQPANTGATANVTHTGTVVRSGSTGNATGGGTTTYTHQSTAVPARPAGGTASTTPASKTGTGTASAPAATSTPATSTSTPTTQSAPATSTATSGNSAATSTPSTTTSSNGGLLGTVTGTLSNVTNPLFAWFG